MAFSLVEILPWIYISIQGLITLIISVVGVSYVRNEYLSEITDSAEKSKYSFCKLWFRIVWKMRTVYCGLAVHVFDVLTDALVIIEWWHLESDPDVEIEHVDARVMAICGIIVLLLYKAVSVVAFWAKEASFSRCLLQFLDLLVFEEIYVSHTKIIANYKNQSTKSVSQTHNKVTPTSNEAIDTTTSFKFVRNLEAVFESIPQSILQLVFIIRTSGQYEGKNHALLIISIISIFQSIISMTNSILKNDNMQMNLPKWKKHKQRLPPTIPFLKHALSRLSEVIYRISLLALFWAVCEGLAFGILMCVELVLLIALSVWYYLEEESTVNIDELCLRVQALIVLPSEFVYAEHSSKRSGTGTGDVLHGRFPLWHLWHLSDHRRRNCFVATCLSCCFCFWPVVMMTTLCHFTGDHYIHVTFRICISLMEWLVLIFWGLFTENRRDFLFSVHHGLVVLIVGATCFFIYSQYMFLFPKFSLPKGVGVRTKEGYAFNGELQELQRVPWPFSKPNSEEEVRQEMQRREEKMKRRLRERISWWFYADQRENSERTQRYKRSEAEYNQELAEVRHEMETIRKSNKREALRECAMFALANGHNHIVSWLAEQNEARDSIVSSDENNMQSARRYIDSGGSYFGSDTEALAWPCCDHQ
eukprot:51477_1